MVKLAILADDLTGANDTGACFAGYGFRTELLLSLQMCDAIYENQDNVPQVISLDVRSRGLAQSAAYSSTLHAVQAVKAYSPERLYKKMDSAIRGHFPQECDAVLEESGLQLGFVAPAYPAMNRTTVGGVHYIGDVPVHETELSQDPLTPVTDSRIQIVLERGSRFPVGYIPLELLKEGSEEALQREVIAQVEQGCRLIAVDAVTDEHLDRLLALADELPLTSFFAGSAGLAEAMARRMAWDLPEHSADQPILHGEPMLVAAGSQTKLTREQLLHAMEHTGHELVPVTLDMLFEAHRLAAEQCVKVQRSAGERLASGQDVILQLMPDEGGAGVAELTLRYDCRTSEDFHQQVTERFGKFVGSVYLQSGMQGSIYVIGGETARGVCEALGLRQLRIVRAISHGAIVSEGCLSSSGGTSITLITKSGSFGKASAVTDIVQYPRARVRGSGDQ
ncbi:four-carbon acid sugar kinase family protein [Paenibacillus sp. GCM10023252]|uniref:four-carbon acid sugar kinase family protein n=1 Tax=Paenibacillus sp. GCM10023252 TaxID=3252649 RepID=UPI00361259D7